ncbi:MAG: hypothetical protein DME33_03880, partial [Verrucomicrobia bacterium]
IFARMTFSSASLRNIRPLYKYSFPKADWLPADRPGSLIRTSVWMRAKLITIAGGRKKTA